MSDVSVTVFLDEDDYVLLLTAAREAGVPVSEFAGAIVDNYVRENYAEV
jgi:hypothetical protein